MKGNGTDAGAGGWDSPETLVPLITSLIGCASALGVCVWVKLKQQFSDKQTSEVSLETEINPDGTRIAKINVKLTNDEMFSQDFSKTSNGKDDNNNGSLGDTIIDILPEKVVERRDQTVISVPQNPKNPDEIAVVQESIQTVMTNNNKGDEIIGSTRNHVIRDAFNTFIKLHQVDAMVRGDAMEGLLNINSLHSNVGAEEKTLNTPRFVNSRSAPSKKKKVEKKEEEEDITVTTTIKSHHTKPLLPKSSSTISSSKPQQKAEDDVGQIPIIVKTTNSLKVVDILPPQNKEKPLQKSKKDKLNEQEHMEMQQLDVDLPLPLRGSLSHPGVPTTHKRSDGAYPNTALTNRGSQNDTLDDVFLDGDLIEMEKGEKKLSLSRHIHKFTHKPEKKENKSTIQDITIDNEYVHISVMGDADSALDGNTETL